MFSYAGFPRKQRLNGSGFADGKGTYAETIMGGHARECWPQLHTVELRGMVEKPGRMPSVVAAQMATGSIPVAIPPGCTAATWIPLGGAPIANVEGVQASLAIIWVLVVAPGALPEEVAVVLGPEVIAEGRHFFTAILKVRSDGLHRAENEDEGAHDQQDNRKVGHSVLLCIECPRQLEWHGQAGGPRVNYEAGWVGGLVKIAQFGTMLRYIANLLGGSLLLLLSRGCKRSQMDGFAAGLCPGPGLLNLR